MSQDLNDEMAQESTAMFIQQGVNAVRSRLRSGKPSLEFCDCCGAPIPEARRLAIPSVELCTGCQDVSEKREKHHSPVSGGRTRYV
ncbi:TraR/DksA family transcriptional regulator [Salmonella enterica subsp. enterica serovar Agona]|nr:TraR/DksA family transcriptional regulator [Salmonella enterica subsp. enterica serovar Agona]